jgi:hypothetical protein
MFHVRIHYRTNILSFFNVLSQLHRSYDINKWTVKIKTLCSSLNGNIFANNDKARKPDKSKTLQKGVPYAFLAELRKNHLNSELVQLPRDFRDGTSKRYVNYTWI